MPILNFSVVDKEFISISSTDVSEELIEFFKKNFYVIFDEKNPVKISLLTFQKKRYNFTLLNRDYGVDFTFDEEFTDLINGIPSYADALNVNEVQAASILEKITKENFVRVPTANQLKNLKRLCSLKSAASFSVPGAGKTTEALAFYAFHKHSIKSKLLVVCPINAFISWQEEIKKCFDDDHKINRLRGTPQEIEDILINEPEFMIINYDALRNLKKYNIIKSLIFDNRDCLTVIFDESHKIKGEKISEIILPLAPFIKTKLILTGTPMPQASSDLRSQFGFLYPSENIISDDEFIDAFDPVFVRTTKGELDFKYPQPIEKVHKIEPNPAFKTFYDEYIIKPIDQGYALEEIFKVTSFKKAVLRLLMFFSWPPSCFDLVYELDQGLALRIQEEGDGAKIDAALEKAGELISNGKKVVIWSSFKDVVNLVAEKFENKAVFIHGDVESEGETESEKEKFIKFDTREKRIKRFKTDPSCMVFVANPAAAAESISLHEVCDHAIYIDRTYNAGQFMQSRDRIHRLIEKEKENQKYIDIYALNMPGSIEQRVHDSLNRKISNMANFLSDDSLQALQGFNVIQHQDEEDAILKEDVEDLKRSF